jgi:hypothetical protein
MRGVFPVEEEEEEEGSPGESISGDSATEGGEETREEEACLLCCLLSMCVKGKCRCWDWWESTQLSSRITYCGKLLIGMVSCRGRERGGAATPRTLAGSRPFFVACCTRLERLLSNRVRSKNCCVSGAIETF